MSVNLPAQAVCQLQTGCKKVSGTGCAQLQLLRSGQVVCSSRVVRLYKSCKGVP
jgi:hypothetical protein